MNKQRDKKGRIEKTNQTNNKEQGSPKVDMNHQTYTNQQGGPESETTPKMMSIKKMEEVITYSSSDEILLTLMSRSTLFEERLTMTKSFNVNTIEMMLKMIALACRSDNSKSLNIWLKSLLESTFFKETLLDFLSNKRETIKVLELKNIILIFDTMVHHWPSFSMPIVTLLIPQMSMIINQLEKSTFEILKQDMHDLEEKLSDVRKQLHCGGFFERY